MSVFDRVWQAITGRESKALPAAPVERRDSSVYNPLTHLGGLTDKGTVGRPSPYVIPLSGPELRVLYGFNGIARRLVDIVPARACRRGWTVPQIGTEDRRLLTWSRVCEAMSMARLYGGSVLLLVTEDDVPPAYRTNPEAWLQQPLDLERVGRLDALQVFDAVEAVPSRWDTDIRSVGYRGPSEWMLSSDGFRARVHASRVIWFRGARRPTSEMRGSWGTGTMPDDSCLQAVWDEIRRLTETLQGGAVMAQELREAVLKLKDLKAMMTGDDADAVQDRIQLMAQGRGLLGVQLIGDGDDFQSRSNPPTGFTELSAGAWEALAAATGIPQVILMGSTPGGLNTDGASSWEGFRQLVSSYQETQRGELERLYSVVYAAQDGPTRGQAPEGWDLVFAPLDEPDERSVAETRQIVAETDVSLIGAGVISKSDVARSRYGPGGYSLDLLPVEVPKAATASPFANVGLPALVQAGIIGRAAARGQLGLGPEAAPTPAELAALAAAGGISTDPVVDQIGDRADAAGSGACILVPAADPGLLAQVQGAIGQALAAETEPHITVLYLGAVAPEVVPEVAGTMAAEAVTSTASLLERGVLRAFPPGPNGTPIVLEFEPWGLEALAASLLRRLAHLVAAKQHRRFRPHLTLGYAPAPLTPEAQAALLAIDVSEIRIPLAELALQVGGARVATAPIGG